MGDHARVFIMGHNPGDRVPVTVTHEDGSVTETTWVWESPTTFATGDEILSDPYWLTLLPDDRAGHDGPGGADV